MKRALAAVCLLLAVGASGCIIVDDDSDSSLTIRNFSDYALAEIHVTETDNPDYGPNLVGGDLLLPGEEIVVFLDCDVYDALVVDEDGFGCEIFDLDLCFDDAVWDITNGTLNNCSFAAGTPAAK